MYKCKNGNQSLIVCVCVIFWIEYPWDNTGHSFSPRDVIFGLIGTFTITKYIHLYNIRIFRPLLLVQTIGKIIKGVNAKNLEKTLRRVSIVTVRGHGHVCCGCVNIQFV